MSSESAKATVVLVPAPQRRDRIFTPRSLAALSELFTVVDLEDDQRPDALNDVLPDAFAIIGQPDLDRERLAKAPGLRAILNVEGNFFPNVDYEACYQRGIYVLGCGPAYAPAVAEHALGLALDVARGISREDRAFRIGRESYVAAGNDDAILLGGSRVGFLGFGNLGRALHRLLQPFHAEIRVFDPWLPDSVLREQYVIPASLEETLRTSQFLFVLATVTPESTHLLGAAELDLLPSRARLVLVSRAAVVDYDALLPRVAAGRLLAGIDVWPEEPVPADHPARTLEGLVFSGHRAGGIPAAFQQIGDMVVDDLTQILRGLPPARMQLAAPELVGRYRNRPVT
ncbi:MAG TPA: hydroxyacid dehydrogenase [Propionibacteriaceae bacterium]|nr:hydroxyacid dehydrogenase [Propionibacteriaceae bacterium]